MNLQEKIKSDLLDAMRSKDQTKLMTLRMLQSSIKNKQIELGKELDTEQIVQVISREIKQRKDSIEQFVKASRTELAEKETQELNILKEYQPAQLSEKEIKETIKKTIKELKVQGPQNMGLVMSKIIPKLGQKADGKIVSDLVKEMLNN